MYCTSKLFTHLMMLFLVFTKSTFSNQTRNIPCHNIFRPNYEHSHFFINLLCFHFPASSSIRFLAPVSRVWFSIAVPAVARYHWPPLECLWGDPGWVPCRLPEIPRGGGDTILFRFSPLHRLIYPIPELSFVLACFFLVFYFFKKRGSKPGFLVWIN